MHFGGRRRFRPGALGQHREHVRNRIVFQRKQVAGIAGHSARVHLLVSFGIDQAGGDPQLIARTLQAHGQHQVNIELATRLLGGFHSLCSQFIGGNQLEGASVCALCDASADGLGDAASQGKFCRVLAAGLDGQYSQYVKGMLVACRLAGLGQKW